MYNSLADAVVVLHLAFIVFVVLGGLTALWRKAMLWVHIPALIWGTAIEFLGFICPLTYLENYLRRMGAGESYRGDFIAHYILPIVYPQSLTRETQWLLGALLLLTNVLIYAYLWHRLRKPAQTG